MKTEKKILITFLLNFAFALFEFIGGIFTGSIAIMSDALHDIGDAFSVGASFVLEKKSKKQADEKYSYGYARFSVLGGIITTTVLLIGSIIVIYNAIRRMITPTPVKYDGMIIMAIIGVCVNLFATILTRKGESLNQKAVNLHMLEDVLGWIVVLIGAVVMRFSGISVIDPIMSILIAVAILIMAVKNLKEGFEILLEKVPSEIKIEEIKQALCAINGVLDVHHIHVWSLDGQNHCATLHVVADTTELSLKPAIKQVLVKWRIVHATIEMESENETCNEKDCKIELYNEPTRQHHHHHHHHHH